MELYVVIGAFSVMIAMVVRLGRIVDRLEVSNTIAEKGEPQRFVKTFVVDSDYLEDDPLEDVLDQEVRNFLGKDGRVHEVQDTFYKKSDTGLNFQGAIRTIIYSYL